MVVWRLHPFSRDERALAHTHKHLTTHTSLDTYLRIVVVVYLIFSFVC